MMWHRALGGIAIALSPAFAGMTGCADGTAGEEIERPGRRLVRDAEEEDGRPTDAGADARPDAGGSPDGGGRSDARPPDAAPADARPAAPDGAPPSDLGPPDGAPSDLGPPDGAPSDLGPPDGAPPPDLGPPDARPPAPDAGRASDEPCPLADRQASVVCTIDVVGGADDCGDAPVQVLRNQDGRARAALDFSEHAEARVEARLCAPVDNVILTLGNSRSNDGHGGDGGDRSYDTELMLVDDLVTIFPGDVAREQGVELIVFDEWLPPIPGDACLDVAFEIANGRVAFWHAGDPAGSRREVVHPAMFQLDEPRGEEEGAPDALMYLGLNVVPSGRADRGGTGVREATITFFRFDGRCRTGRLDCGTGDVVCVPPDQPEDPANDRDDDCNGVVDG